MNILKNKLKTILVLVSVFALLVPLKYKSVIAYKSDFNCNSTSEIIMEISTGRVLFANNIHEKKYMASTTKILTAIVVIEHCDLEETVEISKKTVGIEGSSIYLEAGEKLTVKDLLYGLMLRSGNDCAETLAVHCSGSIDGFAVLMNETAKKIGAKDSHFINPHGLHNDNHYTTAYDLALISCYAMKNSDFKEIVATKNIKIPFTTHDTYRYLTNKNKLLKEFDGATGIKTGFTKKAGRCLVGSCEKDGMELVSVVLNCGPMFERTKTLFQTALDRYKMYDLVENDNIIAFIPIENSNEKRGVYIKNDVVVPLTENEKENIIIKYELPDFIKNDEKKDEEIGLIKIYCKNNLIFSQKIYTIV